MATINRKTGMVRGKIGDEIYFRKGGRQRVKKSPDKVIAKNTRLWLEWKAVFSEVTKIWRELPGDIKNLWDLYASGLGGAQDVETNKSVSYRYCPIQDYPPRPRNIEGYMAFTQANMRGYTAGVEMPCLYPPLGVPIPPAPKIDARYERESGCLVIGITTPKIEKIEKVVVLAAVVWATISYGSKSILSKRKLDAFEISHTPGARVEKRYATIEDTTKVYGYKPFAFKDLPYVRVILGAQVLLSTGKDIAPEISSGWFARLWAFNDTRYLPYEDLFQSGQIKRAGRIKFGDHFKRYVDKCRERIAQKEFVVYGNSR